MSLFLHASCLVSHKKAFVVQIMVKHTHVVPARMSRQVSCSVHPVMILGSDGIRAPDARCGPSLCYPRPPSPYAHSGEAVYLHSLSYIFMRAGSAHVEGRDLIGLWTERFLSDRWRRRWSPAACGIADPGLLFLCLTLSV